MKIKQLKSRIASTIRYHIDPDDFYHGPDKVDATASEIITMFNHLGLIKIEDNDVQEID